MMDTKRLLQVIDALAAQTLDVPIARVAQEAGISIEEARAAVAELAGQGLVLELPGDKVSIIAKRLFW